MKIKEAARTDWDRESLLVPREVLLLDWRTEKVLEPVLPATERI